jgi:hypothetical protein
MKQSKFFSLNWLDAAKALLLLVIATILNFIQETFIPSLKVSPEIKALLLLVVSYIIKNFFTPNEDDKLPETLKK